MTLTSLSFYLLVLALLVLYYLVPKRFQWVVLLIGSYAFYAFVCLRYMGFIVITTLTTYFGARGMDAMTAHMEQTVAAQCAGHHSHPANLRGWDFSVRYEIFQNAALFGYQL